MLSDHLTMHQEYTSKMGGPGCFANVGHCEELSMVSLCSRSAERGGVSAIISSQWNAQGVDNTLWMWRVNNVDRKYIVSLKLHVVRSFNHASRIHFKNGRAWLLCKCGAL